MFSALVVILHNLNNHNLLVIFRLIAVQLILIILLYLLERLYNRNSNLKLVLSDAFADLWKPVEGQTPEQLFPNIDPAKLMEAAKKTDFAKVITDEQRQAIIAGGQDAVAAFTGAMNSVAQAVYANSALATTRL